MAGTYSLKQFLKKTPRTEKHKDKSKMSWHRYVAMATLMAIKSRSKEIFIFIAEHHGSENEVIYPSKKIW